MGSKLFDRTIMSVLMLFALFFIGCATSVNDKTLGSHCHIAQDVSLEDMIGQMLIVGFRGLDVDEDDFIVDDIVNHNLGGVIYFNKDVMTNSKIRNIKSPKQVRDLSKKLQSYANVPLFIAIDQEGGKVARLSPDYGFPPTQSAQSLGELNDPVKTCRAAEKIAQTLSRAGVNFNFAPCVDVNVNPDCPVIGKIGRSFSSDPDEVYANAKQFILAHERYHIITCVKHFPGHGSSTADSHKGLTDVSSTWSSIELIPYCRLINDGLCNAVMTSHVFNSNLDTKYPATLSSSSITVLLREKLEFDGVVISDDLQMKAIADFYNLDQELELLINAGVDIILVGNNLDYNPKITTQVVESIKKLIDSGAVNREQIEQSYDRIMKLKAKLRR